MTASGCKAGPTWCVLPPESERSGAIWIDMDWLKRNWDNWFAYEWNGVMCFIDIVRTGILDRDRRMIVETP